MPSPRCPRPSPRPRPPGVHGQGSPAPCAAAGDRRPAAFGRLAALVAAAALAACATRPDPEPPLPYGAAVAARFPAPAVHYDTPAFAHGHPGFTSNEELRQALHRLAAPGGAASGTRVKLLALGPSQGGVPLEALHFSREVPGPARARVLLVGQQHGDEPASSEALLVIAQRLAHGPLNALLDRVEVIVMPRANPDGAATGRRVTLGGIDANRDHLLLRTSEAQAIARLTREFDPAVVVDVHEHSAIGRYLQKFGALPRNDLLLQYAMTANLPPALTDASERWFRQPLLAATAREGLSTEWYYTNATTPGDLRLAMGGPQPDTGRNVNGLRNAVSVLLESRGSGIGRVHLARRVHAHVVALTSVLDSAHAHADELAALRRRLGEEVSAQACRGNTVVLAAQTPTRREMLFIDPASGADKPITVDWLSSLQLRTLRERARPCGYWLAPDAGEAVQKLRALGVTVQRFDTGVDLQTEAWSETARSETPRPDVRGKVADGQNGSIVNVLVALDPQRLSAPQGSWYVPLQQPLANLVVAALEPDSQNSYFANRVLATLGQAARVVGAPPAGVALHAQ